MHFSVSKIKSLLAIWTCLTVVTHYVGQVNSARSSSPVYLVNVTDIITNYLQSADDKLCAKILHNSSHVLQPLIPDHPPSTYDHRPRTHDKLLLDKTTYLNDREFVIRMLYRDSY